MTLYLSFDGILGALGYSQIARVLIGLGRRGLRYHLVSLESPDRLADEAARAPVEQALTSAGVEWTPLVYAAGTGPAMASNLLRMTAAARRIVTDGATLVHARGYQAGLAALPLGVPYLFDPRGYWIDERLDAGRLFTRPAVLGVARRAERTLYRRAAAVVTLTRAQADDVRAGRFGPYDGPVETIPTCADFDVFRLRDTAAGPPLPALAGRCVVGLVGSVNASYHMGEAVGLCRRILDRRADAHLLVLSEQVGTLRGMCAEAGVDTARTTFATLPHHEMPRWTPWIDWGVQLLATRPSKRASMPTKLAEFLAAGVRPVHFGCNDEVGEWVSVTGSGIVLPDLTPASIAAAVEVIGRTDRDPAVLEAARERARPHFSLETGIDRYAAVLGALGEA